MGFPYLLLISVYLPSSPLANYAIYVYLGLTHLGSRVVLNYDFPPRKLRLVPITATAGLGCDFLSVVLRYPSRQWGGHTVWVANTERGCGLLLSHFASD